MLNVIIPIALLLILVLAKKLPVLGGNINVALLLTGALITAWRHCQSGRVGCCLDRWA